MGHYKRIEEYVEAIKFNGNNANEVVEFLNKWPPHWMDTTPKTEGAAKQMTVEPACPSALTIMAGYWLVRRGNEFIILGDTAFNHAYTITTVRPEKQAVPRVR